MEAHDLIGEHSTADEPERIALQEHAASLAGEAALASVAASSLHEALQQGLLRPSRRPAAAVRAGTHAQCGDRARRRRSPRPASRAPARGFRRGALLLQRDGAPSWRRWPRSAAPPSRPRAARASRAAPPAGRARARVRARRRRRRPPRCSPITLRKSAAPLPLAQHRGVGGGGTTDGSAEATVADRAARPSRRSARRAARPRNSVPRARCHRRCRCRHRRFRRSVALAVARGDGGGARAAARAVGRLSAAAAEKLARSASDAASEEAAEAAAADAGARHLRVLAPRAAHGRWAAWRSLAVQAEAEASAAAAEAAAAVTSSSQTSSSRRRGVPTHPPSATEGCRQRRRRGVRGRRLRGSAQRRRRRRWRARRRRSPTSASVSTRRRGPYGTSARRALALGGAGDARSVRSERRVALPAARRAVRRSCHPGASVST